MNNFTEEQRAAIDARGKTIVSASAGSGKTTVMIEKIVRLIISGTDVKEILAVTFTKKAAAQMKEKLRKELIKAINSPETSPAVRAALKKQLAEVPSADISTIHSFCSKLIRSHFFAAGVDSDFSVIAEDDADGTKLKNDALDEVFEEAYEKGEENFLRLLSVYWRKKSDNRLRGILFDTYSALRMRADYRTFLTENAAFTEEKFNLIVERLFSKLKEKCMYYASRAEREKTYFEDIGREKSKNNAEEVLSALSALLSASDYFFGLRASLPWIFREGTGQEGRYGGDFLPYRRSGGNQRQGEGNLFRKRGSAVSGGRARCISLVGKNRGEPDGISLALRRKIRRTEKGERTARL